MWYKIIFQLEDFGHHNAHLVSKNYLTYPFFTPTQVDYALTYGEDLITHPNYEEEKASSTPAHPVVSPQIIQKLYTIRNSPSDRERERKKEKYPTYGKVQYIPPGTKFCTYSQHKPKTKVIVIGKKRRVARILSIEPVEAKEERFKLTSPDLISHENFRSLNPSEYQIIAMSSRWIYGRFKVARCLKISNDYFVSVIL